jgi:hypothetical protein
MNLRDKTPRQWDCLAMAVIFLALVIALAITLLRSNQ